MVQNNKVVHWPGRGNSNGVLAVPDPLRSTFSGGIIGHVGWAFKIDNSNTWEYGATEDTEIFPGIANPGIGTVTSGGWHEDGAWAIVLDAFRSGTPNHDSNYYAYYRCENVENSKPQEAVDRRSWDDSIGYNVANHNCLTNAIDIFKDYGVTNLLDGTGQLMGPTYYFGNDMSGFEDIQHL